MGTSTSPVLLISPAMVNTSGALAVFSADAEKPFCTVEDDRTDIGIFHIAHQEWVYAEDALTAGKGVRRTRPHVCLQRMLTARSLSLHRQRLLRPPDFEVKTEISPKDVLT